MLTTDDAASAPPTNDPRKAWVLRTRSTRRKLGVTLPSQATDVLQQSADRLGFSLTAVVLGALTAFQELDPVAQREAVEGACRRFGLRAHVEREDGSRRVLGHVSNNKTGERL